MTGWIVLGVLLVGLLVLAAAVHRVMTRMSGLRRAALAFQQRQNQAVQLREAATLLQRRAEELQERVETAQRHVEVIRARRRSR